MRQPPTWQWDEEEKKLALAGPAAYGAAALAVAVAFTLRFIMDPIWMDRLPYGLFCIAVVILAQFVDFGPCLLAIVGGYVLATWFFAAPRHTLIPSRPMDQFNGIVYFGICLLLFFLTWRTRQLLRREQAATNALGRLAAIIESSDDAIIGRDLDGNIISWNGGAAKLYGYSEQEAIGQPLTFLLAPETEKELAPLRERLWQGQHISHFETVRRRKDGELVDVSLSISPVRNTAGKIVGTSSIARDISERRRAEREREQLLADLQNVLGEVQTLSGLLPICAHCKKIRDDKGYWNQIELYLRDHSSAKFTHSICPDCSDKHFKGFLDGPRPGAKAPET